MLYIFLNNTAKVKTFSTNQQILIKNCLVSYFVNPRTTLITIFSNDISTFIISRDKYNLKRQLCVLKRRNLSVQFIQKKNCKFWSPYTTRTCTGSVRIMYGISESIFDFVRTCTETYGPCRGSYKDNRGEVIVEFSLEKFESWQ